MTDSDTLCFSRRDLLKGGGALVIGFSISGAPLPRSVSRLTTPPIACEGDILPPRVSQSGSD